MGHPYLLNHRLRGIRFGSRSDGRVSGKPPVALAKTVSAPTPQPNVERVADHEPVPVPTARLIPPGAKRREVIEFKPLRGRYRTDVSS